MQTATKLSAYHQRKWPKSLADEMLTCTLNFNTPRQVHIADPLAAGTSEPATAPGATTRRTAGATAAGAPEPPPNANPPPAQPRIFLATREVDENNMTLYTMPMDNIIASAAGLGNIDPTADNTFEITYAKNLLNKCIQQQRDGYDSHGRVYSRSSGSRAASTGNCAIIAAATTAPAANVQNCPLLGRYNRKTSYKASHRTINPRTPPMSRRIISATPTMAGMFMRAPTSSTNKHGACNSRMTCITPSPIAEQSGSLARIRSSCFGPMVRGEEYPPNFKAPREVKKYDPKQDPAVWIDMYLEAMGIAGHTKLLATRYLPLLVGSNTSPWLNTLPKNNIDSWDDMRLEFVKHFQDNYSRTTSIDNLEMCVQWSKESTRKWLRHWQETWV
jgi:hypothetical protein